MLYRRIIYLLLFSFFIWLALATRHHPRWFHPLIAKYGGDTIWAGDFLFFFRAIFPKTNLLKLAFFNYLFGVIDEISQLWHTPWLDTIRHTTFGKLLLGLGFMWSDLVCYLIGTILAFFTALLIDKLTSNQKIISSISSNK